MANPVWPDSDALVLVQDPVIRVPGLAGFWTFNYTLDREHDSSFNRHDCVLSDVTGYTSGKFGLAADFTHASALMTLPQP